MQKSPQFMSVVSSKFSKSFTRNNGWRSRGYLPHFEEGEVPQSITFRLMDSLPAEKLIELEDEVKNLSRTHAEHRRRMRIEDYLDNGKGSQWLSLPPVATIVEQSLMFFDGTKYRLHGWVVMPNHVHTLITLHAHFGLSEILHSWKSYTSKKANDFIGREGEFWQNE